MLLVGGGISPDGHAIINEFGSILETATERPREGSMWILQPPDSGIINCVVEVVVVDMVVVVVVVHSPITGAATAFASSNSTDL